MSFQFQDIPGWHFNVSEISAGVYLVKGKDKSGRIVEETGTDPDALIEHCKDYARKVIKNVSDQLITRNQSQD